LIILIRVPIAHAGNHLGIPSTAMGAAAVMAMGAAAMGAAADAVQQYIGMALFQPVQVTINRLVEIHSNQLIRTRGHLIHVACAVGVKQLL
jgi:hypothetical protein